MKYPPTFKTNISFLKEGRSEIEIPSILRHVSFPQTLCHKCSNMDWSYESIYVS